MPIIKNGISNILYISAILLLYADIPSSYLSSLEALFNSSTCSIRLLFTLSISRNLLITFAPPYPSFRPASS